jgi:hypothetical protein
MVSVDELLKRMNEVDWSKVPDYPHKLTDYFIEEERKRFQKYFDMLKSNGVSFEGDALDLGCGLVSFAVVYPNTVGLDSQLRVLKELRKRGIKAIQGDIRKMEFDKNSFDTVLSFYPPASDIAETLPNPAFGSESIEFDDFLRNGYPLAQTWQQRFVQYTAPIARRHVILHDTYTHNGHVHKLNEDFLGFYSLHNLREIPLENKTIICVADKEK